MYSQRIFNNIYDFIVETKRNVENFEKSCTGIRTECDCDSTEESKSANKCNSKIDSYLGNCQKENLLNS